MELMRHSNIRYCLNLKSNLALVSEPLSTRLYAASAFILLQTVSLLDAFSNRSLEFTKFGILARQPWAVQQ